MSNQIHELPPSEMNKELTSLLIENMNSSGFMKKKTGSFWRKENDCEQYFSFSFTRDRGNPDGFSVIRHNAYGCCIAAVLCANGKLEKCLKLLENGSIITDEQKARILEYIELQ